MVGPKTNLIYQEQVAADASECSGGFGSVYSNTWRDVRTFRGNFMEGIAEAGTEKFIGDKKVNWVEYFFIIDKPLRTTIRNDSRFYQKSTGISYEIIDIDNLAFQNRMLEIRLRKVV